MLIIILAIVFVAAPAHTQRAFADGLTQENLPPASIGNRNAALFVKVNPPILTSSTIRDAYIQFRLFDANTNTTIPYTTYQITVTKGASLNATPLLTDAFQAANGLLTIKIQPDNGTLQIFGNQEPFLNAWVADPGGTVNVKGPIFLEGGLYHFHILILTVDGPRNLFTSGQEPKFDAWLSVGDVSYHDFQYNGQNYNATLISYYDKINDFKFDPASKQFLWTMPFDWNTTRLKAVNVFLHEELRVPKSLQGIGNSISFNAAASGIPLTGRQLAVDPYSFQNALTLHYLLNKFDLISMSEKMPQGTNSISFALASKTNASAETSSDLTTDTGGIHVAVSWSPSQLNANIQSTVKVDFSDAFSGGPLNADVKYDIVIKDTNGNQVFSKTDSIAKGGTDTQTINFPKNGTYHIEIKVKELDKTGQAPDQTRTGVARGIVIVPEFPVAGSAFLAVSIAIAVFIILFRVKTRPTFGI